MTDSRREPVQAVLDLVFYAPIGAFFHGPEMVSEMALKGRRQVANARMLGTVALDKGRHELTQVAEAVQQHLGDVLVTAARAAGAPMAGADQGPGAHSGPAPDTDPGPTVEEPYPGASDPGSGPDGPTLRVVPSEPVRAVSELPIPDYDNLSASQVVPRLEDLADEELEAVRDYELAHRGRMTILSRIAQLQAS